MIVAGNRIYEICRDCGKLVQINKFFGSLHVCVSPEQLAYNEAIRKQLNYRPAKILREYGEGL